jgi:hypothetical protein
MAEHKRQLLPQIYLNYRRHSTEGLQPSMMLLWASAGVPLGIYNVLSHKSVALQVQAQILTALSLITWAQCMYYGHVRLPLASYCLHSSRDRNGPSPNRAWPPARLLWQQAVSNQLALRASRFAHSHCITFPSSVWAVRRREHSRMVLAADGHTLRDRLGSRRSTSLLGHLYAPFRSRHLILVRRSGCSR